MHFDFVCNLLYFVFTVEALIWASSMSVWKKGTVLYSDRKSLQIEAWREQSSQAT